MKPIHDNSAWCGEELCSRPEWQIRLSPDEVSALADAAESLAAGRNDFTAPDDHDPISLPRLAGKLKQIQHDLEMASGVVRIVGFPIDQFNLGQAEAAFWIMCNQIGTPVSQSADGDRILSVRDSSLGAGDARIRGPNTSRRLSFHTDRCDVISFLCWRQARSGGDNLVVSSVSLYNTMLAERPDLVEILMQPYLYQRHNVDRGNDRGYCEQPVFSFCEGRFAANLLRVLIERAYSKTDTPDMTPAQREALDYLEGLAERPELHVRFRQKPGDMLWLNNFTTLHRRDEFQDHVADEDRRHLVRIWLSVPNSRPLDSRFAANYGNTAAGALRGGMRPIQ